MLTLGCVQMKLRGVRLDGAGLLEHPVRDVDDVLVVWQRFVDLFERIELAASWSWSIVVERAPRRRCTSRLTRRARRRRRRAVAAR